MMLPIIQDAFVLGLAIGLVDEAALGLMESELGLRVGNIGPGAADVMVNVSAQPGCTWTAASAAPWITIADGRSGTGSGSTIATSDAAAYCML